MRPITVTEVLDSPKTLRGIVSAALAGKSITSAESCVALNGMPKPSSAHMGLHYPTSKPRTQVLAALLFAERIQRP